MSVHDLVTHQSQDFVEWTATDLDELKLVRDHVEGLVNKQWHGNRMVRLMDAEKHLTRELSKDQGKLPQLGYTPRQAITRAACYIDADDRMRLQVENLIRCQCGSCFDEEEVFGEIHIPSRMDIALACEGFRAVRDRDPVFKPTEWNGFEGPGITEVCVA
ncbi:MAG: hypothetical protein AAGA03_17025 [Planctomycetota bacterium]